MTRRIRRCLDCPAPIPKTAHRNTIRCDACRAKSVKRAHSRWYRKNRKHDPAWAEENKRRAKAWRQRNRELPPADGASSCSAVTEAGDGLKPPTSPRPVARQIPQSVVT